MSREISSQAHSQAHRQPLLPLVDALQKIHENLTPVIESIRCALTESYGKVTACDIHSPINVPGYANSAMDGYALNSDDLPHDGAKTLKLIGHSYAGTPFTGEVHKGETVRIMTGAKVPQGADTVIMQEKVQIEGSQITVNSGHHAGENVRHIGEDILSGDVVLSRGQLIGAAELGLLASLGIAAVDVIRPLRVATFSTGDELRSIGESLQEGQIYDSNRYTLFGLLKQMGVEHIDMGIIRDTRDAVEQAFIAASTQADVVITSGGVSVGDADYVKETLDKLGQVDFWKIAMKPGKPLAFGKINDAFFFGLPGNPVSSMATFIKVVEPSLHYLTGAQPEQKLCLHLRCTDNLKKHPGRQDFQRGIIYTDDHGELVVRSTGGQGSHILSSMSQANCFIALDADAGNISAGSVVKVEPFTTQI